MHWRNIAPFCRDDDPQTGPTIRFPATSRHSGLTKVSTTESHGRGRKESLKFILSHSAAQRCVHALARRRGPIRRVVALWCGRREIESSVAMGPRLRGDDSGDSSLQYSFVVA